MSGGLEPSEGPATALSIVIPCFDEEERIGKTLRRILEYVEERPDTVETIVVDDGSRDGTSRVVRGVAEDVPSLRLVSVDRNRGKGAACAHGFAEAHGRRVLLSDADLSTPIEDVERLEQALEEGADLAFGSRALPTSQVVVHQPWWREAMGKVFNRMVRLVTRLPVHDSQCGFKLFDREACAPLFRRRRVTGFSFDVELLVIARRLGLRWEEVPVRWYDSPRSKVDPVVHSSQMFRDLLRIRWWEIRGVYDQDPKEGPKS